MSWVIDPEHIRRVLESAGFDVEFSNADQQVPGGSLTARKDRRHASMTLWADAGGRIRLEVTHEREEPWAGPLVLQSTEFRAVRTIREVLRISGTVSDPAVFEALAALSAADIRAMVPESNPRRGESPRP